MRTYDQIVNDPATNQERLSRLEDRLVESGKLAPLTPSTTPTQWDAYWQAIADEYEGVSR